MNENQLKFLNKIRSISEEITQVQREYWQLYTDFATWQFWVLVIMLVLPLIILFVFIDKHYMLLLGFFGLNYHIWFAYTNSVGIRLGLWEYPYHLIPFLPSFSLDAALVPVLFMLLYQWTIHHKKNIYLYSILLSAILAFILKPMMVYFHFFHMHKWINYSYLFLFYIAFFIVSKLITNLFLWLQNKDNK